MEELIDIRLTDFNLLKTCFELANDMLNSGYEGYKIVNDEFGTRMFLYWHKPTYNGKTMEGTNWFPYKMDVDEITLFVLGWLKRVDFGNEPDTDGSAVKSFHFQAKEFWGFDGYCNDDCVGVIVSPDWIIYGK